VVKLDLRRNGRLTIEQAIEITSLESRVRKEFNDYIAKLAELNNVDELGWLLQVTCRNTNLSSVHDNFCRLALLENILDRGESLTIVYVDSKHLKLTCERIIRQYHSTANVMSMDTHNISKFGAILNLCKSIYIVGNCFTWPRIVRGKRKPSEPVIYIENFLFSNSFDEKGMLVDRYYPGLLQNVSKKSIRQRIWYGSILIGINTPGKFISILKKIRASTNKILLKEDWLTFSDYVKALFLSIKLPKCIKNIPPWRAYCVDEIIQQEINIDTGSPQLVNAILIYLFFSRLKKNAIDLELVIDWNENQVIDRALSLSVRKSYPGVYIKGYQGFVVPDSYACKDPTVYEYEANTIPDEICVIGDAFLKQKKRNFSGLHVSTAPAFRFADIHNEKYYSCDKERIILIVLPISIAESKEIIGVISNMYLQIIHEYKFLIRHHPSYTKERFIKIIPFLKNEYFCFSEKPLYEDLCRSALLISASSSVCLEAAILGVPVAIIGSLSGPAKNPLENIPGIGAWKVCYSKKDILEMLSHKRATCHQNTVRYFDDISSEKVDKFVGTNSWNRN